MVYFDIPNELKLRQEEVKVAVEIRPDYVPAIDRTLLALSPLARNTTLR
jgi:hypothetical protein